MSKPDIDWPALIEQLRASGLSMPQIAIQCDLSPTSVKEWRLAVKTPLHKSGERLVEFWCAHTGQDRSMLPRVVATATGS